MAMATLRPVPPAHPLPSSTVILLRDTTHEGDPFEVLMLERHGSVSFPGVHAFPGGVVDPGDHDVAGAELPPDQAWATEAEGDCPPGALPYWVAAVRELFEEVGILLASSGDVPLAGPLAPEVVALRARLRDAPRRAGPPPAAPRGVRVRARDRAAPAPAPLRPPLPGGAQAAGAGRGGGRSRDGELRLDVAASRAGRLRARRHHADPA